MALPTTNLSLNAIHVEIGGTTGTQCSLNDADIRGIATTDAAYDGGDGINQTSGTQVSIGEFRNASDTLTSFTPTIAGRQAASGDVVYAYGNDLDTVPNGADGTGIAGIWVIKTSTNCYIRVGCQAIAAGGTTTEEWYNTGGTAQGDPGLHTGTGTNVFTLGQVPDSVRIYHAAQNTTSGTPTFTNIDSGGSYTSSTSSFFTPTQDVKYGRKVIAQSIKDGATSGTVLEEGNFDLEIEFKKAGFEDYTITFKGHGRSRAWVSNF